LPPTFGVADDRFIPIIASGPSGGPAAITRIEDDAYAAPNALSAAQCGTGDAVIGVAASGRTAFVLAGVQYAADAGAWTCGIANNSSSPLLALADLSIFLDTGPEVITGSTRLKAGTSQKLVLNRITTAGLVLCGTVISNLMVEITPSNAKLRERAVAIVSSLVGIDAAAAEARLAAAEWRVRDAIGPYPKEST
jgi:N-acetylmuramic acid 6-phosphate etherase